MADVKEAERKRRNKEPLWYCKLIVKYPRALFGLTLGGHIFLTSINFILYAAGYNILPVEFLDFPVRLKDEVARKEAAWTGRDSDDPDKIYRFVLDNLQPTWDRGFSADNVVFYYQHGGSNVFSRDVLHCIKEFEDSLFGLSAYQEELCQIDRDKKCIKPRSVLRYFDGTFSHIHPIFYDPNLNNITDVLMEAYTNQNTSWDFTYFLGKGYSITQSEAFNPLTRTSFPVGWPPDDTLTDRENEDIITEFLLEDFKPAILEYKQSELGDDIEMNYFSYFMFAYEVQLQALWDMLLAIGSLCFIFGFIWFQTGSLWITGWSVLSIVTSFCITNLVYSIVLDYHYFGYLHVISIFIILGIGADDIFVFFNIWQASALEKYPTPAHRLSDCYRRAAGTMFFTSFTTMMAFISGGISPLLPLGSFGIFTGVLVGVNYISVIVFFPTVLYVHHVHFLDACKAQCCCLKHETNVEATSESYEKSVADNKPKGDNKEIETLKTSKKKHIIVHFFEEMYFPFITHKYISWVIVVLSLSLIGFLTWSTTNLEVDAEEIKIYRKENNYGAAMRLGGSGFVPSGRNFISLYLVWGLGLQDYSKCHFSDYKCKGDQVWDLTFDLNPPHVQQALKDMCSFLKYEMPEYQADLLMIRNDSYTGERHVECFVDNLQHFMQESMNAFNGTLDLDLPWKESNMAAFMKEHDYIYEVDELPNTFHRYFEIALSYWMTRGYTMLSSPDYWTYDSLLGEAKDPPYTRRVKFHEILNITNTYYGTKLRYAAIRVNLTLSTVDLNYETGLPVMELWDRFMEEHLEHMPVQLQEGFQTTTVTWHWLKIQQTLVESAILGIIMGVSIACPVLILATANFATGLFATLIIVAITVSVIGITPLIGWKLDVMVSMNLCLLVGLSVDYVVHLAEGYHLSAHSDRLGRVKDMLSHLGISVFYGALTTLGAAFFMIFAQIQFFLQFGSFLLCTIGLSFIYSILFFSTVMAMYGPQGETGSLWILIHSLKNKIIGRTNQDVDCKQCDGRGFHPQCGRMDIYETSHQPLEMVRVGASAATEQTADRESLVLSPGGAYSSTANLIIEEDSSLSLCEKETSKL